MQLWRAGGGLPRLWGKNETRIFYCSFWSVFLAIHCSFIALGLVAVLSPPTLLSQPTVEDAEYLLPTSHLGPTYPSYNTLVTAELYSLPSLYRCCDAEDSGISTKGKGEAQQDGQCLLRLVPVAEGRLNVTAVTAQYTPGISQSCLSFPRLSEAAAAASPSPALPSSILLVFPSSPGLVFALFSCKAKSILHIELPDLSLFTWQHLESGASPSAMWWHRMTRCQQHACGVRERDGNLQSPPKIQNKYWRSNTKSSLLLHLPVWFKYSMNCALLSWLLGRYILGRVGRLFT